MLLLHHGTPKTHWGCVPTTSASWSPSIWGSLALLGMESVLRPTHISLRNGVSPEKATESNSGVERGWCLTLYTGSVLGLFFFSKLDEHLNSFLKSSLATRLARVAQVFYWLE